MSSINSSFNPITIDRNQDFYEGHGTIDVTAPTLPAISDVGKAFNAIQVKNPSVCKYLLVTFKVKQKDGTVVEEKLSLCPGETKGTSFKRDAITEVTKVEILDTSAGVPGEWAPSDSYTALASPTADDFAEDGGSIGPIGVTLVSC